MNTAGAIMRILSMELGIPKAAGGYKFNVGRSEGSDLGFVDSKGTYSTSSANLIMTFEDYTLTFPYSANKNQLALIYDDGSSKHL